MFKKSDNQTNNIPADAQLGERLQHLGDQISAPPKLKEAAKTGIPANPRQKYGASVHVRRFTKAVLVYSLGVCLLIGTVLVVPGLLSEPDPAGSPVPSETSPSALETAPVMTPAPVTVVFPISPQPMPTEVPYCGDALTELLAGKTNLTAAGKVDMDSIRSTDFELWHPDTNGLTWMFNNQLEPSCNEQQGCAGGILSGDFDSGTHIYFSLTAPEKVEAYVITTACTNDVYWGRNPIGWSLCATNDPTLPVEEWTVLDDVWDGAIPSEASLDVGYVVDAEKQDAYQYYCWIVEYTGSGSLNVAEFALYTG